MVAQDESQESGHIGSDIKLKKFSIPKIVYDIALITFFLPAILYLHAHMYKLGKFAHYRIPADYVEVGYQDIISLWSIPLVFIFIFLLPFYVFFVPSEILEELTAAKKIKNRSWFENRWVQLSFKGFYFLLMGIASLTLLFRFFDYWYLLKEIYPLFGSIAVSIALFCVQSVWKAEKISHRLLKTSGVIFSLILLLIGTTAIAQSIGKFQAERKTKYEKICAPERNLARIGRAGDKIIAKEIGADNPVGGKTVLVGSTCSDAIVLEDLLLTADSETGSETE